VGLGEMGAQIVEEEEGREDRVSSASPALLKPAPADVVVILFP
jgi:hypothetical protein